MSTDPYGYDSDRVEEEGPGASAANIVAGVSALVWLGCSVLCCGMCSGVMAFYERKPGDTWMDQVGVWLILTWMAWPLAAIALWTGLLHGLARRWWTSAGPNVVLGAGSGCLAWCVVCFLWIVMVVALGG